MKINKLFILFLITLINCLVYGQITYVDITPPQNLLAYPSTSGAKNCTFSLYYIISTATSGPIIDFQNDQQFLKGYKYYNSTSYIYQLDYILDYGYSVNKNFNFTIDKSYYKISKSVSVACLPITSGVITLDIITPLKYVNSYFESIIRANGLRSELKEFDVISGGSSLSTMKLLYGSYYLLKIDSPPFTNFTSNWVVQVKFGTSLQDLKFVDSPLPALSEFTYSSITFVSNGLSVYSSPVAEFSINSSISNYFIFIYYSDNIQRLPKQPIKIGGSTSTKLLLCSENIFTFSNIPPVTNNPLSYALSTPNLNNYISTVGSLVKNYFNFNGAKINDIPIYMEPIDSYLRIDISSFNYKDTIDSPVVLTLSILGSDFTITTQYDFPYGIKSSSGPKNEFTFVDSRLSTFSISKLDYRINNLNSLQIPSSPVTNDLVSPVLIEVDIKPLSDSLVYIQIKAKDSSSSSFSGVRYIIIGNSKNDKEYSFYGLETLASGNSIEGTYAIIYDTLKCPISSPDLSITIMDDTGNLNSYKLNYDLLSSSTYSSILYNFKNFDPLKDIKSIFFLHNNVNVTEAGYNNVIYIYLPILSDTGVSIYFEIQYTEYRVEKGFARYNSNSKLFEGSFYLPQNLPNGLVTYKLSFPTTNNSAIIYSNHLSDEFQFKVISSKFDTFGPTFSTFLKQVNGSYGFRVNIRDDDNQFKQGYLVVRGEIDRSIYNFTISNVNNPAFFSYDFLLPTFSEPCISQNYIVTDVYLEDLQGYANQFHRGQVDPPEFQQLNPFYRHSNPETSFYVACTSTWNPVSDVTTLNSLIITPDTIDVLSTSRNVLVEFSIKDVNQLKSGQTVYVYLHSDISVIKFPALLIDISDGTHTFSCRFDIPFGFGASSSLILISIHGFISNKGYVTSFGSKEIQVLSLPYKINIDKSVSNRPNILHIEQNQYDNGNLTLIVTHASLVQNITVKFDTFVLVFTNNFYIISPNEINIRVSPEVVNERKSADIYLHYLVNDITNYSNVFKYSHYIKSNNTCQSDCNGPDNGFCIDGNICHCINNSTSIDCFSTSTPTPTSTPTLTNAPQSCKGTPLCGGPSQGECKSSGCVCISPYFGLDCSSKSIEITEPTEVNENSPEIKIVLDTNSNSSSGTTTGSSSNLNKPIYSSSIGVLYLREIDINSKVVNSYYLNNWLRTDLGNDDDSTKYQYDITITNENDSSNTNIKAVLEFYKKDSKVNFANQEFTIIKSSIKYTINISKYSFKSPFNTLQILMLASIESSNTNNACSRKEFGESTSDYSNYIKLQVEDHSFYGRFLKNAIIDQNTVINVTNKIIDQDESIKLINDISSSYLSKSIISISIPHYSDSVIIDPDFSVLLDSRSASNLGDSLCSSNNKSLTTPQLAGIIIACAAFAIIVSVIGTYLFYKKSSRARVYVHKLKSLKS